MLYIVLTASIWLWAKDQKLSGFKQTIIGIIFGLSSVLSTHFGVPYEHMVINVRDIGPLAAGLFFSPASGVIAGLIGGIERYIVGTYFGIGSYTRIACSVSTCLAGFVALIMRTKIFKGRKPSPFYAFFMGSVMEVFHMNTVFITHQADMRMAFSVVSISSIPMIIFTGIGLALSSLLLQVLTGEWNNPLRKQREEEVSLSQKFQRWLFIITSIVILGNFIFSFMVQSRSAYQNGKVLLEENSKNIKAGYLNGEKIISADSNIIYAIISEDGTVIKGNNPRISAVFDDYKNIEKDAGTTKNTVLWGVKSLVYINKLDDNSLIITSIDKSEAYWYRDAQAYETAFADILLFTVIYVLIAYLVNQIVVNNIQLINASLSKITNGNLNEVVTVRNSSEFASLSDDINQTVVTLKGYIEAAEKRIEQELLLARTIQLSALPQNFNFPERNEFELYATMKPAKEVGGDFYDFFFVKRDKIALVIADVSDKGIPAALFMMRSKTAIRSFAEGGGTLEDVMTRVNKALYEGNDAEMFVTAWIGILDLKTGIMQCANAGHEYPAIMRSNGRYELFKDKHGIPLAAMDEIKVKTYELQLYPGDRLFVYTDGVPEAINENKEQYGTDRMIEALNRTTDKTVSETLAVVAEDINNYKGKADQFDDITMLGFDFVRLAKFIRSGEKYKKQLTVEASTDNLQKVMDFIGSNLNEIRCDAKNKTKIEVSVEELFVNIASYAYSNKEGNAEISFDFDAASRTVSIVFADSGIRYNPLEKEDPDITLSAEERQIGGLGIFMVKKYMDEVLYDFVENKNIVTIIKKI